jgi:hypothetical protein
MCTHAYMQVFSQLSQVHLQVQFHQVLADRIQSDLNELVKAVNDRCKKYGLRVKPTTLIELPFGKFFFFFLETSLIPFEFSLFLQTPPQYLKTLTLVHQIFVLFQIPYAINYYK